MKDVASLRRRAILLMRETLALLDEAGEMTAAAHLQMAHDIASRISPMQPGDELPDRPDLCGGEEMANLVANPALVKAIGGALAVLASLMAREGIASVREIAQQVGLYGVATAETAPDEGLILGCWGAMLREVARAQDEGTAD